MKKTETMNEEKTTLVVDFSRVKVQVTFEGDKTEVDLRKSLGNAIRRSTGDIGFDEFARKVYFSDGGIEVQEDFIPRILDVAIQYYNVPTQEALKELFTIKNKED